MCSGDVKGAQTLWATECSFTLTAINASIAKVFSLGNRVFNGTFPEA
jgi:hypothetical protein